MDPMNNSGSSTASSNSNYVSCIEVDGRPILPPLMTESLRIEMRRYRELAVRVENNLKFNKRSVPVTVTKKATSSKIPVPKSPISQTKLKPALVEPQTDNGKENDMELEDILKDSPILSADMSLKMNTPKLLYEEHFVIKKSFGPEDVPAFPSDGDSSSNNDSEDSSGSAPTKTSFKSPQVQNAGGENFNSIQDEDKVDFQDADEEDDDQTAATSIDSQVFSCQMGDSQKHSHRHLEEDDNKSESMSLVSLDTEEEAQRRVIENKSDGDSSSDNSLENYIPTSGRSSTETFIIERHNLSDSDNNNDFTPTTTPSVRKYFFSPTHDDGDGETSNNSIIFNSDNTPNPTAQKVIPRLRPSILGVTRYFDSPASSGISPGDDTLTEISFLLPSTASTVSSSSLSKSSVTNTENWRFDSSKVPQNSPVSSVPYSPMSSARKENYFSSPEAPVKSTAISISDTHVPPNTPSSQCSFLGDSPRKVTRETGTQMATSSKTLYSPPSSSYHHRNEASPDVSTQTGPYTFNSKAVDSELGLSELNFRLNRADKKAQSPKHSQQSQSNALGRVNLVTLQSAMQNMSPSFYKVPPDARSNLLKGLVLTDPLFRPKRELRIPQQALDPAMKPKFDRVSAAVKGYLIRRILRTEKIQMVIQTIRDTVELVLKLYEEVPQLRIRGGKGIKQEDADLCRRLFQQLTGACASFHDVFFKLTTPQRMAIIANDREKLKAKEMKTYYSNSRSGGNISATKKRLNNSKRKISTATAKYLARRSMSIHN